MKPRYFVKFQHERMPFLLEAENWYEFMDRLTRYDFNRYGFLEWMIQA